MTDRENVIKGLEDTAEYFRHLQTVGFFGDQPIFREHETHCNNALALLKEQEAVVRCKDCKWYWPEISWCNNSMLPKEQTFFCADGKRR